MTNVDRAMELMTIPVSKLPPLALEFAKHLCGQIGMCGEVLITAYAAYAQCVESCPCDDSVYDGSSYQHWFDDRLTAPVVVNIGE